MTNFLEYRPRFEYRKQLEAKLQEAMINGVPDGQPPDGLDGEAGMFPAPKLQDFLNKNITPTYTPSQALVEYVEISPVDTLMGVMDLKAELDAFAHKITNYLRDNLANGPSVDEYILARAENNYDVIQQFEEQSFDINGSSQADMLPLVLDLQEEFDMLYRFSNDYFFKGKLADNADLAALQTEEEETVRQAIELDKVNRLDTDALHEQNHVAQYIYNRTVMVSRLLGDLDNVINIRMDDAYGEGIETAVESVGSVYTNLIKTDVTSRTPASFSSGNLLENVQHMVALRFDKQAKNFHDSYQRMTRMMTTDVKESFLNEVAAVQYEKLNNRHLFQWMEMMSPDDDISPLNAVFMDLLEGSKETLDLADTLTEDLYKMVELERIQLNDYTDSLYAKTLTRGLNGMVNHVEANLT